jgi:hypothetical protein
MRTQCTTLTGRQVELVAEFVEVESGKRNDLPKLAEALAVCKRRKATLVIAKLDPLPRNVAFIAGCDPTTAIELPDIETRRELLRAKILLWPERPGSGSRKPSTSWALLSSAENPIRGGFLVHRKTRRDRMLAKLQEIKQELRQRMHQPIREQGKWLKQVVSGYCRYHAVPTNSHALMQFRNAAVERWRGQLSRRSQKGQRTWPWIDMLADYWIPRPRTLHPWPEQRFAVTHPR